MGREIVGQLRLEFLWSKLPYMGLIYLDEEYRGRGIGCSMHSISYFAMEDRKRAAASGLNAPFASTRMDAEGRRPLRIQVFAKPLAVSKATTPGRDAREGREEHEGNQESHLGWGVLE